MAAIIVGTTGATWGLNAEIGILVQTVGAKTAREKNIVRNATGDAILISYFNPTVAHTISGVIIGPAGIASAQPGVALTLVNTFNSFGGINAGGIYTDDVDINGVNNEFTKITVNATQYAGIY
jgi:hypothetical protein